MSLIIESQMTITITNKAKSEQSLCGDTQCTAKHKSELTYSSRTGLKVFVDGSLNGQSNLLATPPTVVRVYCMVCELCVDHINIPRYMRSSLLTLGHIDLCVYVCMQYVCACVRTCVCVCRANWSLSQMHG